MTKRIVSGIFLLIALGALGLILAGALTSGEQLIVRFLTAIIVAALGLYVISDLRLQANDDAVAAGTRTTVSSPRVTSGEQPPPNSTAAFMATVTGKRSASTTAGLDDRKWNDADEQAADEQGKEQEPTIELAGRVRSNRSEAKQRSAGGFREGSTAVAGVDTLDGSPDHEGGQSSGYDDEVSPYSSEISAATDWPFNADAATALDSANGGGDDADIDDLVAIFARKTEQEMSKHADDAAARSAADTVPAPTDAGGAPGEEATPAEAPQADQAPSSPVGQESQDPRSDIEPAAADPAEQIERTEAEAERETTSEPTEQPVTETDGEVEAEAVDPGAESGDGVGDFLTPGAALPAEDDAAVAEQPAEDQPVDADADADATSPSPATAPDRIEAASYAEEAIAPIIDLRLAQVADPSNEVEHAIHNGELEVISSLMEQGVLSAHGPISDRDVRTMVYVAFTSSELRKILLAGGTIDGDNSNLDLGDVEVFPPGLDHKPKALGTGSQPEIDVRDDYRPDSQAL